MEDSAKYLLNLPRRRLLQHAYEKIEDLAICFDFGNDLGRVAKDPLKLASALHAFTESLDICKDAQLLLQTTISVELQKEVPRQLSTLGHTSQSQGGIQLPYGVDYRVDIRIRNGPDVQSYRLFPPTRCTSLGNNFERLVQASCRD